MARNRQVKSRTRSSKSTSAAQVAANRANAQHSTGPRTAEGKERVAQNALKHGLFSRGCLAFLEGKECAQDRADYEDVLADMHEAYAPGCRQEVSMVDRMAFLWWHLSVLQVERATFLRDKRKANADGYWNDTRYVALASAYTLEEGRAERSFSRLQRDFIDLKRMRGMESSRWKPAAPATPTGPVEKPPVPAEAAPESAPESEAAPPAPPAPPEHVPTLQELERKYWEQSQARPRNVLLDGLNW